jgi:transposase-like protein
MRKKRAFSAEFKAQLVLEVLSGAKSQAECCREYGIKPELLSRWRGEALARLPDVFRRGTEPTELARIAELERAVGRLTLQLEAAKKVSRWLTGPPPANGS